MKYLPIFADLADKHTVVIGGGSIAHRKASMLLSAHANVTLVAPVFSKAVLALAEENDRVNLCEEVFNPLHVDGALLVIAATDDEQINARVFELCEQKNILVNVVDDTERCRFIFPAIVDRSPIIVAISSGGSAPVLARRLRERLETLLPQHLGPLATLIGRYRDKAKATFASMTARRGFWERVLSGRVVSLLSQKQNQAAEQALLEAFEEASPTSQGEVYIVGGGPGDPDLLTLRALQLMQQADVVIYDGLVSKEVLNLARRDADMVDVRKKAGFHSVPQPDINALIVQHAKAGKKVCRLKGGDPFIFGRGGEEVEELVKENIPFQVVPGITAAAGCSAYAGIPLTHRDYAQSVQFVTGHCRKDGKGPDWESLAKPNQTLLVYMGLINSMDIQSNLTEKGRSAETPVALVENGTRPEQRVVTGTLGNLAELIKAHQVKSPALIVIGEVVELQSKLAWFGQQESPQALAQPIIDMHSHLETEVAQQAASF